MELIRTRNAHQGIPELLDRIERTGIKRDSRNGQVLMFKEPCTIVYEKPQERVIFWPERNANPFFNLLESCWMMAGRRDVKFVEQFVKRMKTFSDDGENFHAAYGYRWRKHFGMDQLTSIISGLKKDKNCRRQVLGIWDPKKDLEAITLDKPCNLSATFQINTEDKLDMVVHNRSNDAIMGALSANATHFSILQEYLSTGIGIPVGRYWQVSSNMHVYKEDFDKFKQLSTHSANPYNPGWDHKCPYSGQEVTVAKVVDLPVKEWDKDLLMWMENPFKVGLSSPFFRRIATPMFAAHTAYKKGDLAQALEIIKEQMPRHADWTVASKEWLERKQNAKS
jgi:thymidylate synthase